MMIAMPCVQCDEHVERHATVFRMYQATREVVGLHGAQNGVQSRVQRGEHADRDERRDLANVGQEAPCVLIVRFDRRIDFGEGKLDADVRIGVTVGNVMHQLAYGPAAVTIGRVERCVIESTDGRRERRRLGGKARDV